MSGTFSSPPDLHRERTASVTMDESSPLLSNERREPQNYDDAETKNVVDFDPNGDLDNPYTWSATYKWSAVSLLALTAFTVTFTCISLVPVAGHVVQDLDGRPNKSASVLLVTIWELGEAAGPMFVAPLSELFGRYPVMNAANILFIAATVLAALSPSAHVLIAARFLTGLAVASNVLNPAIVGDMFISEERGTAMSLIMLAPLLGGAIGPAMAGFIAESLGWRSVLWISAALAVFCEVTFLLLFRETFKVRILNTRAAKLRQETGDSSFRTVYEIQNEANPTSIWSQVMRPAVVLFGSGVLQVMSVFGSVVFTYFYVMSTTLPDILETIYGLSPSATGAAFISFSAGSVVSVTLCNRTLDRIFIYLRDTRGKGVEHPEYRLPLVILGGFLLPVVVAMYGWTAQARLPLPVMLLSVALMGAALMLGFLPLTAYVVDAFGMYSASAMTAIIVTRCLVGTFLPLLTEPLVEKIGYGLAFTTLAALSLSLAPIPVFVMRYGQKWRQKSPYTRQE
ncbi:Putative major facilitator superfamily, MFS transporter superfamily [Septoria linicola]|uniref:Major facilitator superfamily, MFS transporter superfamily n=1 Tax=Septoria linicola TaxID=215465 RepID=A0A9Q9AVY9_9PEZI|nr:Putative major facilitator superfamily, MFS transporter superfamily [Septoria linicola]